MKFKLISFSMLFVMSQTAMAQEFDSKNTVPTAPKESSKQPPYKVGGRDQRVRFFVADDKDSSGKTDADKHLNNSPQHQQILKDPIPVSDFYYDANYRRVEIKYPVTHLGKIANSPNNVGLSDFSQSSHFGLVVNPSLITCAADILKVVKRVGDKNAKIMDEHKVDEINVFLRPIEKKAAVTERKDYKLWITPVAAIPNDPALNIMVPYATAEDSCMIPSDKAVDKALKNAAAAGN